MIKKRWIAVAATTIVIPLTAAGAMASAAPAALPPTNPLKPVILCNNLQGGTCNGTPKSDTLIGGQLVDHIFGGAGDDDIEQNLIFLQGASDDAHGGPGRDCIDGGGGNSQQFGDDGDDLINDPFLNDQDKEYGGPGNDVLNASDLGNDDIVDGGPGNDTCFGDPGDTFRNCERIYRVPVPLLVNPAGLPVPLPRALGCDPNAALPKLPAPTTS